MPPVRQNGYCSKSLTMRYTYLAIKLYLCMYCIRDVAKGGADRVRTPPFGFQIWDLCIYMWQEAPRWLCKYVIVGYIGTLAMQPLISFYVNVIVLDACRQFHWFLFVYFVFCSVFK